MKFFETKITSMVSILKNIGVVSGGDIAIYLDSPQNTTP